MWVSLWLYGEGVGSLESQKPKSLILVVDYVSILSKFSFKLVFS